MQEKSLNEIVLENIRLLMRSKKMKIQDMAKKLGVKYVTLNQSFSRKSDVSVERLKQIADIFDMRELNFFFEEHPFRDESIPLIWLDMYLNQSSSNAIVYSGDLVEAWRRYSGDYSFNVCTDEELREIRGETE